MWRNSANSVKLALFAAFAPHVGRAGPRVAPFAYNSPMCGRYVSPDDASLEREFNLVRTEWRFPANFNVAPTQQVPAIRAVAGVPQGVLLRWGLVPYFAKGSPGRYSTINARVETLETTASFRGPWRRAQRCILPAMGFYEWHVNPDGTKQPFYIHAEDQEIFGFAGLWDRSQAPGAAALESCTIITLPASPFMAAIHNAKGRMPAILPRALRDAWLTGGASEAKRALSAYPDEALAAYPVTKRVNTPRNNDENLIEPLSTETD
jgi:putative SOS response-associated peptidase YedK